MFLDPSFLPYPVGNTAGLADKNLEIFCKTDEKSVCEGWNRLARNF